MKRRLLSLLFTAALASLPIQAGAEPPAAPPVPGGGLPEIFGSRSCGTPPSSPQDLERVEIAVRRWAEERNLHGARGGTTIPVAFHVITSGLEGLVTDGQIAAQIDELNDGFHGTGYRFELASVDRTDSRSWFKMTLSPGKERVVKGALARDPSRYLNLYTCGPGGLILGWAYYPWSFPESDPMHGVVVHYGTLPGGTLSPYNLGRTAVHEVGHYLGLLHTFENGCQAPGDFVADTPFEATAASGCPEGRNTCPDPGLDPIHNFMDYTTDACVTEFTSGQDERMDAVLPVYRPSLFRTQVALASHGREIGTDAANPGDVSRAIEFRGGAPNPFRSETAVRFTLPRSENVKLRVFDVAGKQVRTLIDAALPAGSHSALFSGRGLPAGLYFLHLQVGGTRMTRSVVLLR